MAKTTRRNAIAASLVAGATLSTIGKVSANDEKRTKDQEFVIAAGMTEAESEIWRNVAKVAGDFFRLPELHPTDNQEVASAIHIIQNKLLSRPTYRKYLELAKAHEAKKRERAKE